MSDNKSTLELTVEKYGISKVKRLGGRSIKLTGYVGIPDRLHLIPHGIVLFVEYKRPKGGVFRPLQIPWLNWLKRHGFNAEHIHTRARVDEVLDRLTNG